MMELINGLDTAYTLQYEIQSVSDNCLGTGGILSFTIQPLPNIDAGDSLVVCVGDTVVLNATGASNIVWSNGIQNGVPFQELTAGNFLYTVEGTDPLTGCSNSDQLQITVNTSPNLNLDTYEQTICAGGTATFEASGIPSGGDYSWNDPNTTITGTLNVVVDANTVGTSVYTVYYDLNGCIASDSVTVNSLPLPEIILTGDTICTEGTADITSSINPSNPGGTYAWSPGGEDTQDITISGLNIVGSAADTNYTYTLTYTDASGCSNSASTDVIVYDYPDVTAPPVTICEGDTAQLTASANIPNGTFTWYHSSDLSSSIGIGASVSVADLNTPSEQFYVVYELNDCSDTALVNVTVNENPIINIQQNDFSVCASSTSVLSVDITPPTLNGTYIWAHDPSLDSAIVSVSPQQTTIFSVFFVSDDNCFSNSDSVTITVIQNPEADIVASDTSICLGDSVVLSSAFTGLNYEWFPSGETTEQITLNFSVVGSYIYTLNVSIPGCSEVASDEIEIVVNPIPEILSLTASSDSLCLGDSLFLSSSVSPLGGVYTWTPGSITSTGELGYLPDNIGLNDYLLSYELNGCAVEDSISVYISPIPLVNATASAICSGDTSLLSATVDIPGGSFEWYEGTSQVGTGASLELTPSDTTVYSVVYTTPAQCVNDTTLVTAYSFEVPVISGLSNYSICPSDTLSINASVSISGGSYTWTNDQDSEVSVNNPLIVSPNDTTLYTLDYEVDYGFDVSCSDTAQVLVNVFEAPVIGDITTSICSDIAFDIVPDGSLSGNYIPSNTTYTWSYVSNPLVNGLVDNTTASPSIVGEFINTSVTAQTVTAIVTPQSNVSGLCEGAPFTVDFTVNPTPLVSVNTPVVCDSAEVTLSASVSPTGGTYSWLIDPVSISYGDTTQASIDVVTSTTTPFSLFYTVSGCTVQFDSTIIEIQEPILSVSPIDTTICAGETAVFVASANPLNGTYVWSVATQPVVENILTISPSLSTVTSDSLYSVYYTYESCPSDTVQIALHINGLPAVSVENDTICFGDVGSLTAAVVPSSTSGSYNWSPGNITSSSIDLPNLVVSSSAIDSVHVYDVTYTDSVGCSNQASGFVTVYQNPEVLAPSVTICEGDTAQLEAVSNIPNGIYNWYAAGDYSSSVGSGASIILSGLTADAYIYNVVYETNGCSDTATVNLTVNAKPNISIEGQDTLLFCPGAQPITLATTVTPMAIGGDYLWLHDNSTNPTTTISPSVSTVYEVQFTSDDGCQSDLDQVFVSLVSTPEAIIDVFPGDTICSGDEVTLSIAQIGANYSWSTLETSQSITDTLFSNGSSPQTYTYSVTVTIPGCSEDASDEIEIVVNPIPEILSLTASSDSLCLGDSLFLSSSVSPLGGVYTWTPGSITSTGELGYLPDNIGLNDYLLSYELNGCAVEDSISVYISPIPLVNATASAICSGDTSLLSATVDIPGGSFEWYEGTSQVGTGASLELTPSDTTVYSVVYTTPAQCVNDTTLVTAYSFEVPVISGLSNYSICPSDTLSINASVSISGGSYTWTNDQDSEVSVNNPLIVSPNDTTLYTLDYEVDYGFDVSCSDTAQVLVNVFEAPVIGDITTSICSDIAFDIVPDGSLSGNYIPSNTTYTWSYVSNPLVNGLVDNTTASPSIVGEFINTSVTAQTVTAIVTPQSNVSGLCEGAPFTVDFTVNPTPLVSVNTPVVCDSAEVTLSASVSPTGGTYSWLIDPVSISYGDTTQASIDVVTSTTTPFSLFYTVSGCTVQFDSTIIEIQEPILSVSPIDTTICAGETAVFVASANPLNGTYVWSVATQPVVENILTISPSLSTVTSDSLYSVYYTYESCPSDTVQIALHINGLPAVSVENDTICFGDVGSLTAAVVPSSTSGSYNWSPGNITSSSIDLPNLVVSSSAIDSVHVYDVTYTDSVGCSNQASGFVTVYQNPEVLAPSVTICEGDTAQLEAVSNIPNGIYNWYAAGDYSSSVGSGASIILSGLTADAYIYNVVYETNGCSDTATVNLTVNAKPNISIEGQDTLLFCPGAQPITLATTVTPMAIGGDYLWLHDNSTNPTTTISPSVSTVYEVQFTSDDGCQSDLDQVFVTVVNNALAEIEAVPGDTICSGESIVLSVSQVGANYSWSTLETTQSITDTLFSNGNVPQIYTYNVTVTIPGCSEVAVDTIEIVVNPIPSILSLTVDSDSLCLGNEALFSVTSEPSGGLYTWTPGSVTNSDTFTHIPGNVGLNLYNLQYEVDGCSDYDSIEVFVNPTPIIELISGDKICSGDTAMVSAQADISGGVYVWYQDGFQIGEGNTLTLAPSDTVLLEMVYTTSGVYGCPSDTSFSIVEVYPVPEIIDLNSFNVCPDSLSILDASTDIAGGNYIWSDDSNSGLLYGNTNPISVSPSDTTLFTLVYEMPYANNTVFCYDTAQSLINIYEAPVIGNILDTICSGFSFNVVPENVLPNYIPTGTMYEWTYFNNPLVSGASDNFTLSPDISDGPLINSVSSGQTVTYTVYPVSGTVGNCPGTPFNLEIYITSSPQITDKFDTICSGANPSIIAELSDVYPTGTSFEWVVVQDNSSLTGQSPNQSGPLSNLDNQELINITDTIQSLIYSVTPFAGSCFGDNFLLTVSILPAPSIQNASDTICSDQPWVYYPGSIDDIVPIGTQYDWSVNFINTVENENSNFGLFEDSIYQLNPNIINITSEEQIIIYNVIPTYSGCAGDTFDIALSVAPKPILLDHSITTCSGNPIVYVPQDGLINQVVPEGTLYSW